MSNGDIYQKEMFDQPFQEVRNKLESIYMNQYCLSSLYKDSLLLKKWVNKLDSFEKVYLLSIFNCLKSICSIDQVKEDQQKKSILMSFIGKKEKKESIFSDKDLSDNEIIE